MTVMGASRDCHTRTLYSGSNSRAQRMRPSAVMPGRGLPKAPAAIVCRPSDGLAAKVRHTKEDIILSLDECIDFTDLHADTVAAVAEHEGLPPIIAAQMGAELLRTAGGVHRLHRMFRETLEFAARRGRLERARTIEQAYQRFVASHPVPGVPGCCAP